VSIVTFAGASQISNSQLDEDSLVVLLLDELVFVLPLITDISDVKSNDSRLYLTVFLSLDTVLS
jgi:hypothetical protein